MTYKLNLYRKNGIIGMWLMKFLLTAQSLALKPKWLRKLQLADAYLAEKGLKPFEEMTADKLNNLSDEVHKQYMEAFKIIGW